MNVMLLAAGLGTRMRPLTDELPKCMLEVNKTPLIGHHLDRLVALGVKKIVVNLGWCGKQVRRYVQRQTQHATMVEFSKEDADNPLETGGGIYQALPLLGKKPFLVVNGDVWTDYPYRKLLKYRLPEGVLGHLVLVRPPNSTKGDYALKDGKIFNVSDGGDALTFSGISILSPELFASYLDKDPQEHRFPLRDVFDKELGSGKLSGELYDGEWRDIGTIDSLNKLRIDQTTDATK